MSATCTCLPLSFCAEIALSWLFLEELSSRSSQDVLENIIKGSCTPALVVLKGPLLQVVEANVNLGS
jgi:hypothetical protein